MKSLSWMGIALAALIAAISIAGTADAQTKCQRSIAKAGAAYAQARTKSLGKCEVSKVAGKLPLSTVCETEEKTAAALAKQLTKLQDTISKSCGADSKTCDGDDEDPGWPATCPDIEASGCTNVVGPGCIGIADCIQCTNDVAVDQAIALYSANLLVENPITDKTLNKCQQTIIKATQAYLISKSKALQKCWDAVLNGKGTAPCPSPGDGKAVAAIQKAEEKKVAAICKACGGDDKACTGSDNFTPAEIGFVSNCLDLAPPGDPSCSAVIGNLNDIVECLDCVTDFKVECIDGIQVPEFVNPLYASCNPLPTPTPTPTATSTGPTPTRTPVPTVTATPCPFPTSTAACPSSIQIDVNGSGSILDSGWAGLSHDNLVPAGSRITVSVSGCAGTNLPTCGECTVGGPIANAGGAALNNHRCAGNGSWVQCASNTDCTNAGETGPCLFFFGAPLPLSNGAVPICVTNEITSPLTGTINLDNGDTETSVSIVARVFTGVTVSRPCPTCDAGACTAGPRSGQACSVSAVSPFFGNVSYDCPPAAGSVSGTVPITLTNGTGTQTRVLSAANPACTQSGYGGFKCQCDTCNNAAGTPCANNADCIAVGATICGGTRCLAGSPVVGTPCTPNASPPSETCRRCVGGTNAGAICNAASQCTGGGTCPNAACGRTGVSSQNNACVDAVCSPDPLDFDSSDEGFCAAGPFDPLCSIETFRGCAINADCRPPGEGGTCVDCAPGMQTCKSVARACFNDNGIIGQGVSVVGIPQAPCGGVAAPTLGTLFCLRNTESASINQVAGLPGLGRLTLKTISTLLP